jgi:ribosome maturation factor RimP
MSYQKTEIIGTVRKLVLPILDDYGLELVDVEYLREPNGWVVRVFIEKEGGVTLSECTTVSRELGYILEVKEVIDHPYNLEVSSPGLDRPLKTEKDFQRFSGKKAVVKTAELIDGRRNFKGTIRSIENGLVTLDNEGETWTIPFDEIAKAKLIYEFPD